MSRTSRRDLVKGALATGFAGSAARGATPDRSAQAGSTGSHWERPPKQQGNGLNLIVLVSDTFRADNLRAYGSEWIDTPNLNRFADQSVLFEDGYPEGMPTIPIRRTLYTGRRIVPTYYYYQHEPVQIPGWHHLYNEDVTLAEILNEAGYHTALVADVPHLPRPGRNFHRGFHYYEWIRGQEIDYYAQAPRQKPDFTDLYPADYLTHNELSRQFGKEPRQGFGDFLNQYTANRRRWLKNGSSIVEQTATNAIRWLDENHAQGPFFLHVEAFDPHEPWDPPHEFLEKYLKEPTAHRWPEPPYADVKVPEEGVKRLRANYAGEASNVDYWYGKVLDKIGQLGLFDNSIVVFLSDHGALLNEQGQWVKGPEKLRTQVTHIPVLIRVPAKQYAGKRVSGFVQVPDLLPTFLGRLNLKGSSRITGEDLWPYVTGEKSNQRNHAISAFGYIASVRTHEWNYSAVWNREKYVGSYSPQLYNRRNDPQELRDAASQNPAVVKELQAELDRYIASGWDITRGSFNERVG
jgi:arylsulfatase A-like enzyme